MFDSFINSLIPFQFQIISINLNLIFIEFSYKLTDATICFPREENACAPLPLTLPLAIWACFAAFV